MPGCAGDGCPDRGLTLLRPVEDLDVEGGVELGLDVVGVSVSWR